MGEKFSNLPEWPCEPYATLRMRSYDKNTVEGKLLVVLRNTLTSHGYTLLG